jgi:8-oxo-dGTP pyrophosphatase MutT (NUDIX family)
MKPWKLLDSENIVDAPWLKVAKEKCELPNGKVIDDFYTLWQPDWVMILPRTKDGKWVMTKQYRHGIQKIALEFPAGIIDKGETPEDAAIRELQEECGYTLDERRETKDERRENAAMRLQTRDESGERCSHVCMDPIAATTSCSRMTVEGRCPPETESRITSGVHDNNRDATGSFTTESVTIPTPYDLKPITYLGSFSVNPDRHRGRFHVVFIDGVERLGNTHFDDTEDIETLTLTDEELQAKIADGTYDHPLQIAGYFKWKLTQK